MKLFSESVLPPRGAVLTIGNFDGVHIGHQKLIKRVIEIARQKNVLSLAITFEPHPRRVLGKDPDLCMISSFEHKAKLLADCGLDGLWVIPFDLNFAKIPADEFIEDVLFRKIAFSSLVVSEKYFFGKDRLGDASLLNRLSKELGFSIKFIS
ncbi:MAG: adenylyltransferase/cytidyltransferase family protein, partial [Chlamydiota bacterium]|nr:adenylyltransferase/cytidyltransferase family protein [Chlamydiota bacterium]